jgi:hypothetical protein
MSTINYAVTVLKVQHVVVCGHYCCGGVKASMEATDLGILNPWLRNIRDVYRLHRRELNAIEDKVCTGNNTGCVCICVCMCICIHILCVYVCRHSRTRVTTGSSS